MCGRFASARKRIELLEEFAVQRDRVGTDRDADYNVAPTKPVYAVLTRRHEPTESAGDAATEQAPPERELRVVRWGLVPFWAKDPAIGSRMINARAETLAEKPAFRRAFSRRRCLLPADGFYEWQAPADGGKRKQPYYIYRSDGGVLAFAGLYELWRDPSGPDDQDGAWLWTATIITTSAPDEVGKIHDRMPMVIERPAWDGWLDPDRNEVGDVGKLLVPAAASGLTARPVSAAVNNVRNNGPELVKELTGTGPGSSSLPQSRSGPSGEHPPDGATAAWRGTLF
jgi:putative SOS response-associated peptidase YedK